jgi:predicted NAD-dependent protein-ADP-ribosyltransferase YbiA (DUF1768 family)
MDIKAGKPYPSGALSNFARRPFVFRGLEVESIEGFLQGLKKKSPEAQVDMFKRFGIGAKRAGSGINWQRTQTLWFQGTAIKRDSQEYQDLLDEAYNAMFDQNPKARKALLDTKDAVLKHAVGRTKVSETVLTRQEFCSRLMNIRARLRAEDFVEL